MTEYPRQVRGYSRAKGMEVAFFDCDGTLFRVGDKVSSYANRDGIPVGIPGVVKAAASKGRVRVEFLVDSVPWVRVVLPSVLRKQRS